MLIILKLPGFFWTKIFFGVQINSIFARVKKFNEKRFRKNQTIG